MQEKEKENAAPKRHGVPALAMGLLGLDLRLDNRHPAFLTEAEDADEGGTAEEDVTSWSATTDQATDRSLVLPRVMPEGTAARRGKPTAKETKGYRGFCVLKEAKALLAEREQQGKAPRQPTADAKE